MEAAAGQPRGATVESLRTAAAAKRAAFELAARNAGNGAEAAVAFADNSRRAFFKEFSKVVEAADVIIEVLDARDPAGCRCLDVERFVRRVDPSKKIFILLNKIGRPTGSAGAGARRPPGRQQLALVSLLCLPPRFRPHLTTWPPSPRPQTWCRARWWSSG